MSFSAVAATSASEAPVQALRAEDARRIEEKIKRFVFNSSGPRAPEQKACREIAKKYLKFDQKRYKHYRPEINSIVKKVRNLYKLKQRFKRGAACDTNAAPSGGLHTSDTAHGASAKSTTRGDAPKTGAKPVRGAPRNKAGGAKKGKKPRMTWTDIDPPKFDANNVLGQHLLKIKQFHDENGYFIISNAASPQERECFVREMMLVLSNQGHKPEYSIEFKGPNNTVLDMANDDDWQEIWKILQAPLDAKTRKMLELGFPVLHQAFGATCAEELCQLPTAIKIRTSRILYEIASAVIGTSEIWSDMNRPIQKLPRQGDDEFLHFDFNPFAEQQEGDEIGGLAGKLNMSGGSSFILVPKTHTAEFKKNFIKHYSPLYTMKKNAHKMTLDPNKDPEGFFGQIKRVKLNPGDWIVWNKDLLHGVVRRPVNMPIDIGMYLAYMRAVNRAEYEQICGLSEKDDRKRSYEQGVFPHLWPSLDKVRYVPLKYENFPHLMANYLKRLRDDHPGRCTHVIKKTGEEVPWLQPVRFTPWVPPELDKSTVSRLGSKIPRLDIDNAVFC